MGEIHEPDPGAGSSVPVEGAFEMHEGTKEHLITLTRHGQLLQAGDVFPAVPGIEMNGRPFMVHAVNEFGTETCDACTDELEGFHMDHPDIPVYSLTKQDIGEVSSKDDPEHPITHVRLQVDQDTAIDLGMELKPGQDADEEFWPNALRRSLVVVGPDGKIIYIQQPEDQEEMLDFESAFEEALTA